MSSSRGFTLVEVCITVAIIALVAAVAVPAISNVSRAELRQSASQLSGTIRGAYDSAALSGQTHRLVIDLASTTIKVEVGDEVKSSGSPFGGLAGLLMGGGMDATGEGDDDADDDEGFDIGAPAEILALFGGSLPEDMDDPSPGFSDSHHDLTLTGESKLMDVWIAGMDQPAIEGRHYLTFFPHGYTQDAIIHLTDPDGNVFSVSVEALTGRTKIAGEYVEVPK